MELRDATDPLEDDGPRNDKAERDRGGPGGPLSSRDPDGLGSHSVHRAVATGSQLNTSTLSSGAFARTW